MRTVLIVAAVVVLAIMIPRHCTANERGEAEFLQCSNALNGLKSTLDKQKAFLKKEPVITLEEAELEELWQRLYAVYKKEKAKQRRQGYEDIDTLNAQIDRMNSVHSQLETMREEQVAKSFSDLQDEVVQYKEYFRINCSGAWKKSVVKQGCSNKGTELFCSQAFDKYLY